MNNISSDENNAVEKSGEEGKRFDSDSVSDPTPKISETEGGQVTRDDDSFTEDESSESPSGTVEGDSIFSKKIFSNDSQDVILVGKFILKPKLRVLGDSLKVFQK